MQSTRGCVPVNVTQWAFKSIFMCSAPYVAVLSLLCQSQHHGCVRSDTSFIFPVLLLICLFFLCIAGGFLAPKDFLPVFSDFCPASFSLFLSSPLSLLFLVHLLSCLYHCLLLFLLITPSNSNSTRLSFFSPSEKPVIKYLSLSLSSIRIVSL